MIKVVLMLVFLLFVGNMLLLDYFFVDQRNNLLEASGKVTALTQEVRLLALGNNSQQASSGSAPTGFTPTNSCPQTCLSAIASAVGNVKPSAPLIAPVIQTLNQKGEYFIPLGTGSVDSTANWTDITSAQAAFDAGNYSSIKSVYFEVFLHTTSGGEVHARLFDATTPAVFFNTDLKSTSATSEFLSVPITLKTGQKTYRVQMYSNVAAGFLDQARIRIVAQ